MLTSNSYNSLNYVGISAIHAVQLDMSYDVIIIMERPVQLLLLRHLLFDGLIDFFSFILLSRESDGGGSSDRDGA